MFTQKSLQLFRSSIRGDVIEPSDPRFESARALYNAMIDRRPALIVQCRDTADVMATVKFAREQNQTVAVRGGSHNGAGLGSVDKGVVIDLSLMKGVRVDPKAKTVRVQGGATWGDVDHATHVFGQAIPSGILSTTGVGGLTLGGGIGMLTRQYGLTIDNLVEADVVLADGCFETASERENSDLFWALRGGGGNFGVVTSFLFKTHPVHTVYGGPIFWELSEAKKVMPFWRDYILKAPSDFNAYFGFQTVPPADPFPKEHHLKKTCAIVFCYTGDPAKGEAVLKPFRDLAKPIIDFAGPVPWPALQTLFDPLLPPGLQWYWNADFFVDLTDKAVDLNIRHAEKLPTVLSVVHIYPVNGAAHKKGRSDTAWSFREANFAQVIAGVDPDPANNERMIQWSKEYWRAMHPYSAGGAYVNMMMDEGQERVQAAYRDNYPRLAAIKQKYDPTNFFHVNQNIHPDGKLAEKGKTTRTQPPGRGSQPPAGK